MFWVAQYDDLTWNHTNTVFDEKMWYCRVQVYIFLLFLIVAVVVAFLKKNDLVKVKD